VWAERKEDEESERAFFYKYNIYVNIYIRMIICSYKYIDL
jgi:hypothetical protein